MPRFVIMGKLSHIIQLFPLKRFLSHLLFCAESDHESQYRNLAQPFYSQRVKKVKNSNREKWSILCCDFIWGSFELYFLMPTIPCQAKDLAKVHLQNCLQIANAHIQLHSTGTVPTFDIKLNIAKIAKAALHKLPGNRAPSRLRISEFFRFI